MRTVFLGTSDFAAAILQRLAASPHRPQLVITRPDRPHGRGRRLRSPPVAAAARELGIALEQPEDVNAEQARAAIAAARPDVVLTCAFGALIREPLLSEHELINVHPSLLPRWRGAAPVERAIMAGDTVTGVSIMRVTAGLDSGPVHLAEQEPIAAGDDYGALARRLQARGGELLLRALAERPQPVAQDEAGATYAEKIGAGERTLAPDAHGASELERTVRALSPHIGARIALPDGSFLGVLAARPVEIDAQALSPPLQPGALVAADGRLLLAAAGPSTLELTRVQPPGGRSMSAADYLRGHSRV